MVSQKVTIKNPQGMHMRPAAAFAGEMAKYPCAVSLFANGTSTDGKNMMHLIAACLKCGTEVEIRCDGAQEAEALAAATELIRSGFGE